MTIAKELKPTHFFTLFFMPTAATLIKNGNKNGVGFSLQSPLQVFPLRFFDNGARAN